MWTKVTEVLFIIETARFNIRPTLLTGDCCVKENYSDLSCLFIYLVLRSIGLSYVCLILNRELRPKIPVIYFSNNTDCQLCCQSCMAMVASDEKRKMKMEESILRSHPSNWSIYSQANSPLLDHPLSTFGSIYYIYLLSAIL